MIHEEKDIQTLIILEPYWWRNKTMEWIFNWFKNIYVFIDIKLMNWWRNDMVRGNSEEFEMKKIHCYSKWNDLFFLYFFCQIFLENVLKQMKILTE